MRSAFSWALRVLLSLVPLFFTYSPLSAQTATPAQCIDCHSKVTPSIVSDWKLS